MKINQLLMNLHRSDGFFNHAMHGLQTNILTPGAEQLCAGAMYCVDLDEVIINLKSLSFHAL
jgi:hypothetical protein